MATTTTPLENDLRNCCDPTIAGLLDTMTADRLAHAFKALSDPTRVQLLSLIATHPDAESCVCHLTDPLGLSQPTVSHHLKQLVDAGLLTREQRGRWSYYRFTEGTLTALATTLEQLASKTVR